jgi:hypothetical protein
LTDSFVQVNPDGVGKKMQTIVNTVGADDVHAEAVYIVGTDGSPNYTVDQKLRVSTTPYLYDVARGNIPTRSSWSNVGYNGDVDNVEEDLWSQGGKYVFPDAEMQMEVFSADAADDIAGTGVQKVLIHYLDSGFVEHFEELELNGGVKPTVATDIYRLNGFNASQVGTGKKAAGQISLRHLADTPVYNAITLGDTRARNAIYTVPLGSTLYVSDITVSSTSSGGTHYGNFTLRSNYNEVYDFSTITLGDYLIPQFEVMTQNGGIHVPLSLPLRMPEKTTFVMSAISDVGAANTFCRSVMRGWLET